MIMPHLIPDMYIVIHTFESKAINLSLTALAVKYYHFAVAKGILN